MAKVITGFVCGVLLTATCVLPKFIPDLVRTPYWFVPLLITVGCGLGLLCLIGENWNK